MTQDSLGRELPRGKPVALTFYDHLLDVPFTTTFYVRDEELDTSIEALIEAIRAVTPCVLGKYKIGYQEYLVPGYWEKLKSIPPQTMGGQKWVVKYRTVRGSARSFTIPGRDLDLSIQASLGSPIGKKGKAPNPNHPKWQSLVKLVKQICVSKEGEPLKDWVELDYRDEKWPPKSAKRR